MDKTALNYANLFGYQETLGLKGQEFNYLSASTLLWIQIWESTLTASSGIRWLLLRSVPMWMASWEVSSPARARR